MFASIQRSDVIGWSVKILSPNTISNTSLRRRKYNLNALSHDTAIELVQQTLDKGVRVTELYVDTVGPKEKYQVVSAASICAKVVRDRVIKEWRFPEGAQVVPASLDRGSGYPGGQSLASFCQTSLPLLSTAAA